MRIACHITFHNKPNRRRYLRDSLFGLIGIPGISVFVHTDSAEGLVFDDPRITVVLHDMTGLHPFDLVRMSRTAIATQVGQFDYFMYMEDDIGFSEYNFKYYMKYHDAAKYNNSYIGFIRYEVNAKDGSYCFTDISKMDGNFTPIMLGGRRFFTVSENQYHAMWILDAEELKRYIADFNDLFFLRKLHYVSDIRASAAIGPIYAMFKQCVYADEPGVLIHHMPDNYTNGDTATGKLRIGAAMTNVCDNSDCVRI